MKQRGKHTKEWDCATAGLEPPSVGHPGPEGSERQVKGDSETSG